MSSGSRVRREGTIAMSSKPYARRPFLPRPISTSMAHTLGSATDGEMSVAVGLGPLAERLFRNFRELRVGLRDGAESRVGAPTSSTPPAPAAAPPAPRP